MERLNQLLREIYEEQDTTIISQDPAKLYIDYFKGSTFQQPVASIVEPNTKAIQEKLKFLEQWLGKVSIAGPGGGEVNFRFLDDVNRASIQEGYFLTYNNTTKKFEFVESNAETAIHATGEPMGHENLAQSKISFDNITRTFTIEPVTTSYTIFTKAIKRIISNPRTITIPNASGLYFIYFDIDGILQYKTSYFDFSEDCMTAYVYWNAEISKATFIGDERHGIVMDWQTHEYLHRTRGSAYASGFKASNYVINGNGSSDAHIQCDITGGTFYDEDLQIDIVHSETPVLNTWQQHLIGPAQIPMMYRTNGTWRIDVPNGTIGKLGSSVAVYNNASDNNWTTPDISNGKYGVTFILATNNINYPIIGVLGQGSYANQSEADTVSFNSLNLTGFPVLELRPLYKIMYEVKNTYTNYLKSRIVKIDDLRSIQSVQISPIE